MAAEDPGSTAGGDPTPGGQVAGTTGQGADSTAFRDHDIPSPTANTGLDFEEHAEGAVVPSVQRQRSTYLGRSVGWWGIERRSVAGTLTGLWQQATDQRDRFAFLVDDMVDVIETQMPRFQGIPGEDFFAAMLQLLRDSITGRSFDRAVAGDFDDAVRTALFVCRKKQTLDAEAFDEVLSKFVLAGRADETE